ncbi:glycosyltransferase family 2 protein [Faecalicatena sp. Marseille-Q4148]|nr:glycosyltransferase family 2 protein [Faecalicatena sp. Marseille-Q4148]
MSQEVRVEVLMSVMHQDGFDIAYKTSIDSDVLIINQCDKEDYQEIVVNGHLWRMISTTERGLSKSRNMALKNAKGDICLFCDDDELMAKEYTDILINAFSELTDATGIVFNLNRINNKIKKSYYQITEVKEAPLHRAYGSPMLAIKTKAIKDTNINFNEKFGSGTQWGGGEDSLFEHDVRKKGMKIYEYPAEIATVDYSNESKWFHGYTAHYFYNLGGYQQYLYKNNFVLKFLWRIYNCYKLRKEKELSSMQKLYWMCQGGKGIKKDVTYTEFLARQKK